MKYKEIRSELGRGSAVAAAALGDFHAANVQYRNHSVKVQIDHEQYLMSVFCDFPKRFHQYIRSKKVGRPSVGLLVL